MKTMGKRILALALTLCLVLALGTTAHAAAATPTSITGEVTGGTAQAGKQITQITVTAEGGNFAEGAAKEAFTVDGNNVGLGSVDITDVGTGGSTTITLTVNCTPTQGGKLIVKATQAAFDEAAKPDEAELQAEIQIEAADDPQVSVSGEALTAGQQGQITLTIDGGNTFASELTAEMFTVSIGGEVQSVSKPTGGSTTTQLSFTPSKAGTVSVTKISKDAFQFKPASDVSSVSNTVTVNAPNVTATASGDLTQGKAGGSIVITATGSDFISDPAGKFSFEGAGANGLSVTSVTGGGSKEVTLTMSAPTSVGAVTVNITADAFKYQPDAQVPASGASVIAPTGNVTATLKGDQLYAGTQVNGQTIEVTVDNDLSLNSAEKSNFQLSGAGSDGLDFTASGSGKTVTLSLIGKPNNPGEIKVKVLSGAFVYPPSSSDVEATSSITVKNAPTVTMQEASMVAGDTNTVTVTISGDNAKFASGVDESKFSVKGIEGVTSVTGVTITDRGTADKTAQITLNAVPTTAGSLTITVQKDAFTPVAAGDATATVSVSAPTGGVNAVLEGGTLTAGTAAGDTKIKLTTTGTLNFKDSQASENFTLENGTTGKIGTLTVSNAEYSGLDKSVTLTLTGIPEAGGDFTVKVKQDAFVAKTQDPTDITATGSLTIGYPTIKLTADRDHIAEGDTVTTITLTATGSPFNEISAKDGFTLNGEGATGVELQSVQAAAGTYTVTLTLSGTTSREGDFTITVPKTAFQYQPETDPKVTITVGEPEGTITGTQNGKLYVGTPADGVTITVTITDSKGLHFDPSASTDAFTLGGTGSPELTVKSVAISGDTATLTLSGTPTTAGDFTITAETSAFKPTPKQTKAVTGEFTVGDPNVALTVSDNTLQAGAENGTVTLTLTGSKFVSALTDMVTLVPGEDYKNDNLTIDVKRVDDTTVTVTVNGVPSVMGKISFEFKTDAFTPAPTAAVTVAVDVAKGEQAAEAEANPGAPGIGFTAPLDQLAAAVLTPDEQALYEKGAEVKIELVESVGAQIPQTDKTAVEAAVGDYTVGEYLDVSLVKSVNGVTGDITKTNTPIQVVFTIPTDLRAANRSFAVIRVHDGTATLLEPVASTAETITVESSLFSTYAIVYREVVPTPTPTPAATETPAPTEAPATPTEAPVEPTETPETTEAPDTTEAPEATDAPAEPTATPAGTEAPKAPETGDGFMPGLWMGLLAVCAAGLVLTLIQLRRRSRG